MDCLLEQTHPDFVVSGEHPVSLNISHKLLLNLQFSLSLSLSLSLSVVAIHGHSGHRAREGSEYKGNASVSSSARL